MNMTSGKTKFECIFQYILFGNIFFVSDHEMDDARSKHSVGSSTCYSNKKLYQRPKRKPTNRKKRKTPNEEPFYNNVTRNHDESPDDNQVGQILFQCQLFWIVKITFMCF